MVQCCIMNCRAKADKEKGIRLFSVPSVLRSHCSKTTLLSERRRAFWIERINRHFRDKDLKPQTRRRVCSRHFVTGQTAALFDYMKQDWAPTLFMGYDQSLLDSIIHRQQLSLAADMNNLESLSQPTIDTSPVKTDSDNGPVENISSGDILVVESLVCEPSVNEISEVCENGPVEDSLDCSENWQSQEGMSLDEVWLTERKISPTAKLKKTVKENKLLCQRISECEQDVECLKTQVDTLRENNSILITTVHNLTLHEDTLRNDDSKVAYYTGLPTFKVLMYVFELVSNEVAESPLDVLPKFQQCLMVLMRLRLSLQEQDLAYRFNVHVSTVHKIFYRWLSAMSNSLEQFINWPSRESLIMSMPLCFQREWGDSLAVILDCFEIFTESSSVRSKATSSALFKSVKVFVAIAPQGIFLSVCPSVGGAARKRFFVEESDILNHLLPNDVLVTGRVLDVGESKRFTGAQLLIPASTKGKAQLHYNDAELTSKIANVGSHTQRLIRLVTNRYSILKSVLPDEFLNKTDGNECSLVDHIVKVCCSLSNLCPPIFPSE